MVKGDSILEAYYICWGRTKLDVPGKFHTIYYDYVPIKKLEAPRNMNQFVVL